MSFIIVIRPFSLSDTPALITLFRDAVHAINIQHYSPEQVAMWAPEEMNAEHWQNKLESWQKQFTKNITFVAEIDGKIVGFADMTRDGYLDHLYIHKDYQGRWVAFRLLKAIEQAARDLGLEKITTDCSITAKVPAERVGFVVVKEQTVVKNGVSFINYAMEKKLKKG
ncbi:MAG TPA: GNAT family N-acetyltransferase [Candidatus Babeliales bacterium]|nr:GNAT family N-acetyltransferase [Candidatus Babeliales bacterium]